MCVQGRWWLLSCRLKMQCTAPVAMRPQRFGSFPKTSSPRPETPFEGNIRPASQNPPPTDAERVPYEPNRSANDASRPALSDVCSFGRRPSTSAAEIQYYRIHESPKFAIFLNVPFHLAITHIWLCVYTYNMTSDKVG